MSPRGNQTVFLALGRHAVHPFPARMAPEIVCSIVKKSKRSLRVLDPMMGSGTVVALAQSRDHKAIGIDIDPLAALITSVWTSPVQAQAVRKAATKVLSRAQSLAIGTRAADSFPTVDVETRKFIRYWFDCRSRRQLMALSSAINQIKDRSIKNLLWCAFSRLIIAKKGASRALDLVHSRPHRHFKKAPVLPFSKFEEAIESVLNNVPSGPRVRRADIRLGDARKTMIKSRSIDLVLTSPPYLNAIDYMRCSKFSLVWMGYTVAQIRQLRAESVGTEVGLPIVRDDEISLVINKLRLSALPNRQRALVSAYIVDMRAAIAEVARVLVPGGRAFYVVGENTVRGVYVRNSTILRLLAVGCGLSFEGSTRRALPSNRRYMPPPTNKKASMDARMRSEIVIEFKKRSSPKSGS
jgi:hypothetical protein